MIVFLIGTRPDIIKMSPLIKRVPGSKVLHTGQHFTAEMDRDIQRNVGITFDHRLSVPHDLGSGGAFKSVFEGVRAYLQSFHSRGVVVAYGDTLSAMAGAVAAKAEGWKVAHVEAGLRSFDLTMPEEVSRIAIDGMSDRLYAPTEMQRGFLVKEGIDVERVKVMGNVIVDAVRDANMTPTPYPEEPYVVATFHRPENVDNRKTLQRVLEAAIVLAVSRKVKRIILPCHPRARENIEFLKTPMLYGGILQVIAPVLYTEMLALMRGAEFMITDSGGMQEECAVLGKKCVTIRKSTERQETIEAGYNYLVSPHTHEFSDMLMQAMVHLGCETPPPCTLYGDHPSELISEDLRKWRLWNEAPLEVDVD